MTKSFTASGLTSGIIYEFKIESRNSYGYSELSDPITLLAAFKPDAPITVGTANYLNQVVVTWSMPVTNGSPITGYRIYIQEHNSGAFTQESVECDGTLTTTINDRTCSILLETLKASPYNLVKDEEVYVKVIAENYYGDSPFSSATNGAII